MANKSSPRTESNIGDRRKELQNNYYWYVKKKIEGKKWIEKEFQKSQNIKAY